MKRLIKKRNMYIFTSVNEFSVGSRYGTLCYTHPQKTHIAFYNVHKGTHTVYFSSSFFVINQKPVIPRTDFHSITTWIARSSV